jgi:hypothetical protein
MFDRIERLKAEWTDRYVVVDSPAPELSRFARSTGQVKTVNMNGRCLVEFDQFNNIGWYDIDPSALRIVPKPVPKPATEPKAKPAPGKPALDKAATPKPAAPGPKTATTKPSVPAKGARPSTADILAAARGKAAAGAAAPPGARPSTADILAAARGKKAPGGSAEPPPAAPSADSEPVAEAAAEAAPTRPAPTSQAALPQATADKIAWCREHDRGRVG